MVSAGDQCLGVEAERRSGRGGGWGEGGWVRLERRAKERKSKCELRNRQDKFEIHKRRSDMFINKIKDAVETNP